MWGARAAAVVALACGSAAAASSGGTGAAELVAQQRWARWAQSWQPRDGQAKGRRQLGDNESNYTVQWALSWLPEATSSGAEVQCSRGARSLLSLHNANDSLALAEILFDPATDNAPTWLGLRWDNSTGNWSWYDGSAVDFVPTQGGWLRSTESNVSMCVMATASDETTLSWETTHCADKHRYVCGSVLGDDARTSWSVCAGSTSASAGYGSCAPRSTRDCAAVGLARCGDSCVVPGSAAPRDCAQTFAEASDELDSSCPTGCDFSVESALDTSAWNGGDTSSCTYSVEYWCIPTPTQHSLRVDSRSKLCMRRGAGMTGDTTSAFDILCPAAKLNNFVYGRAGLEARESGLLAFLDHCDDPDDPYRFELCTKDPACPTTTETLVGNVTVVVAPDPDVTCPCGCELNSTRSEMCVRFLREMKTDPSCLFVALYGDNDLGYSVSRDTANAIIERDTLYCPAISLAYDIQAADGEVQAERNAQIWFLLYIFCTILLGELTRTMVINVAIPPSMFLILEGILIGWYVEGDHPGVRGFSILEPVEAINPFMLFYIFLPGLAFEAAYNMNIHIFKRSMVQIMSLSLPGVTLGTALLGVIIHEVLPYDWSWQSSFLLGCILVATDTVGQQRFFMDSDQPSLKKLGTLIDAECQLDSDFAIILFWALLNFQDSETVTDSVLAGESESLLGFLRGFGGSLMAVIGGGFVWGIFFSIVSFMWMYRRSHDTTGEATFSLSMSFLSCLCAELFHQSGLIAILTVGLFMNYHGIRLGRELMVEMKRFWDIVVHIVEALLFVTTGMVCYVRNHNIELDRYDFYSVVGLYFAIHIVRLMVVGLCGGLVSKVGYGLEFKEGLVLVWGGLTRGAVSLALSLCLASRPTNDPAAQKANALAVLFASVMTFLTVFINGGTVKALTYKLGLVYTTPAKQYAIKTAWSRIEHETKHIMNIYASDSMYGDVDWDKVRSAVALPNSESFYKSDPWEDMEAISDLFLSPLGWAGNLLAWVTCDPSKGSSSHVSIFGGALGLVNGVFDDPNQEKSKGKMRRKNPGLGGDWETKPQPEKPHPMSIADYTSAVARNKHVFNKLRSAQFRVETRKRMIHMEFNSYMEQYDDNLLGRSAVMWLMQELEHQADHHKVLEASDVIHLIQPGCLYHALYEWQPSTFFKLIGFGVIRGLFVGSILNSMTTGWDTCEAFCRAKQEVSTQLHGMIQEQTDSIIEDLKKDIKTQIQDVKKAQCLATALYPDIMRGVKTKKITKQLLNKSLALVLEQQEDQMLDREDVKKLAAGINLKIDGVFNVSWKVFITLDEDVSMVGVLDTLSWVQSLTPVARSKLETLAQEKKFAPADSMFMREERSTSVYVIVTGFAEKVNGKGEVTQYCGAGTLLGELSVLTGKPSLVDVRTVTDVTVCELQGKQLLELMGAISIEESSFPIEES